MKLLNKKEEIFNIHIEKYDEMLMIDAWLLINDAKNFDFSLKL